MLCMPEIPETTVQKMTSAITILMSLMKPSPSGFISTAVAGQKWPTTMPKIIAAITWIYRTLYQGLRRSDATKPGIVSPCGALDSHPQPRGQGGGSNYNVDWLASGIASRTMTGLFDLFFTARASFGAMRQESKAFNRASPLGVSTISSPSTTK